MKGSGTYIGHHDHDCLKPSLTRHLSRSLAASFVSFACGAQVVDSDKYEVIYVSPRNYFVFTPMLAASAVGTVDVRSITEPIRMANPCVKYVSGEAIEIFPRDKKVRASYVPRT